LSTSSSSFDVTLAPGEAYIEGWCCRDVSTTLTLPANATSQIVVGWDSNAVFDPNTDVTRDQADETIVDLQANVSDLVPQTVVHEVTTDGSGVVSSKRVANVGGFTDISSAGVNGFNTVAVPTTNDLPPADPPQIAFVESTGLYLRSQSSVPFSIENESVVRSITTQATATPTRGFAFGAAGTKLFEIAEGSGSGVISESTLSTAFDLSTASFTQSINSQDTEIQSIAFSDDGTQMFVAHQNSDQIFESSLSTAFDLSTASLSTTFDTQTGFVRGVLFSPDGTRFYESGIVSASSTKIFQFEVSNPFDLSTATLTGSIESNGGQPSGLAISPDGTRFFEIGPGEDELTLRFLSDPFDITTATLHQTISKPDTANFTDVAFNTEGTKLFTLSNGTNEIIEATSQGPDFVPFDRI
jgi:hypothetical protein